MTEQVTVEQVAAALTLLTPEEQDRFSAFLGQLLEARKGETTE